MKSNHKYFILILILISASNLFSQNTEIKNRWNIKSTYFTNREKEPNKTNYLAVEGNYGLLNLVELGCYANYGFGASKDILYGANFNFHILPIFIESKNLRFDVYTSGKLGVLNSKPNSGTIDANGYYVENDSERGFTWGCYLGSAYYLSKHFGFFIESGYEHSVNVGFKTHLGITFKF